MPAASNTPTIDVEQAITVENAGVGIELGVHLHFAREIAPARTGNHCAPNHEVGPGDLCHGLRNGDRHLNCVKPFEWTIDFTERRAQAGDEIGGCVGHVQAFALGLTNFTLAATAGDFRASNGMDRHLARFSEPFHANSRASASD